MIGYLVQSIRISYENSINICRRLIKMMSEGMETVRRLTSGESLEVVDTLFRKGVVSKN